MKTWYRVVCDQCKQFKKIYVSNPSCTAHYLSEKDEEIQAYLESHYSHNLRFIHSDLDMDNLWDTYEDCDEKKSQ